VFIVATQKMRLRPSAHSPDMLDCFGHWRVC
jgi:hypothetical protein